ncbi:MAG TPA: selenocysteine-specific translation elongation factor, partial [Longimicrobiales bacterium]
MKQLILGTAGHIDHGKTSLVKALTGIDTDRLPEEKARGITIDLGFAHLQLEDMNVGIVDVPGHEGLIRNMLAGATGFDAVLLVVAADEGVMPQTREHIAIAKLLDVQRVVVAITKADVVDPEWLELVRADVDTFVRAELGKVPVVPVSSVTGAGLPELRQALSAQLREAAERAEKDIFRMPIDRVFTVHGTGTVVTGTVWSGRASRQDMLRLLPSNRAVRVRGVQTHGAAIDAGGAGERAAFALSGVDRSDVSRGDALVDGGAWRAAHTITARIQMLPAYSLTQRQRVRIHLGTAEVLARVVLLTKEWVQLRLEAPLVARARDRFVIRSYSPVATIGGGQVAELERFRKRLSDGDVGLLTRILDDGEPGRILAAIHLAAEQGCTAEELAIVAAATSVDVPSDVV